MEQDRQDRKEYRRSTFKQKRSGKTKDVTVSEKHDKNKIKSAFKNKKRDLEEEEIWEQWQDEVY